MLAYCISHDIVPKSTPTSFGARLRRFTPQEHRIKPTKKQARGVEPATSHILSDIINPGITPQLYRKTSRSESLSLRLCYLKPVPPKCSLQFITYVGAIPPGKSYDKKIEINEQNKKRL